MAFSLLLLLWTSLAFVALPSKGQLGLSDGLLTFTTPAFSFKLVKDSQTAYSLHPTSATDNFDFIPYDVMSQRQANGQYHLGDITFRARTVGSTTWIAGDSSSARKTITPLPVSGNVLAAANLSPTLPANSLLNITRRWVLQNGILQLLFDVQNTQSVAVEIGSLGAPLEFNNVCLSHHIIYKHKTELQSKIFTGRSTADTNANCSLFDPYIGQDAGFVQVTPLLGTRPPLVVTPVAKSPLEGWRFLPEDTSTALAYQSQTFEALYEWQFHTLAYAQNEWASVTPWNAPTSFILEPNQTRTYGLQFNLAESIRGIDDALIATGRPTAVGIPGYILPMDQVGKLFLSYSSAVKSVSVSPSGALTWASNSDSTSKFYVGFDITPKTWGRSRLTVTYADGTIQTVHYYVTKASTEVISDLGNFLTTSQWFQNASDPFRRSPSVISYDRSVNAVVKDEARAWIAGLSDEAGAGSWLAAAMKQFVQPNAAEITKMEAFVNQTLRGSIQNSDWSVKKSVYFYQPSLLPNYSYPSSIFWGNWWSWDQADAFATDRAYDYVHVTAAYWSLYRVARNYPSLVKVNTWQWYLNQAVQTVLAMTNGEVGYADDGLMDETVIVHLLNDLKREGLTANATAVEARMRARQQIWAAERYPFGSEMAWDSTGQEGVYAWSKYFNDSTTAINSLNSILAYQPTIPHWGYNGNARRYWDNIYGGKLQRIERQIHHYGSGLNALPLISQFQSNPDDFYLLRVGYGGLSGPLTNIDQSGFASASFHSFADTLMWDAYSGDYGPNFVGHALNAGTFIVNHATFGWQAFGGKVTSKSSSIVQVQALDPVRRRVFVAPFGMLFELDAGAFADITVDTSKHTVKFDIVSSVGGSAASAPQGRIAVTQTSIVKGITSFIPEGSLKTDAGAWAVPFKSGKASVTFTLS